MRITDASGDDIIKIVEGPLGTPVQGVGVEHEITVSNLMRQRGDSASDGEFREFTPYDRRGFIKPEWWAMFERITRP